MSCEWHHDDCKFENVKCDLCFTDSQQYRPKAIKKTNIAKRAAKADGRMGSNFEFNSHKRNQAILNGAVSSMTLNSGATVYQKGDEQIQGIIRIMEELKTKVAEQAPGKKTFTIQKKWLDKLAKEAPEENMEFWYLKFKFQESDNQGYIIVDQDMIMSMVLTMSEDRKEVNKIKARFDAENKRRELAEVKLLEAQKEIELLKAELELAKIEKENM